MQETREYNPYYITYIKRVASQSLLETLAQGMIEVVSFYEEIPSNKLLYSYAEGKWTPKEVLQHLVDTERVFSYRALFIARSVSASLAGMDQDEFAAMVDANAKSLDTLLEEFIAVRTATITLFKSFNEDDLVKIGEASGSALSVRAAGYIIAGHELHHCEVIKERYL